VSEPQPPLDPWEEHLSAPVRDRQVIVAFEVLAGMTRTVADLARWGARPPLLVSDARGVGPIPDPFAADVVELPEQTFPTLTEQVRARMSPQQRLTPDVVAAIDAYDPDRQARWWVSPVCPNADLLGRAVLGGRPQHQARLEDKMLLDDLLSRVGAPTTPAVQCLSTYDDLMPATDEVVRATGDGQAVWSGDARDGTTGGGDLVRWIRTDGQATMAAHFFAEQCDRVRVAAFLDGVPCSIHAMCLPDGVVVFNPVELAILRDAERGRFVTAGMGTTWSPPPVDAQHMQALARAVGTELAKSFGYRGGFGIDGVLTADGFRVTEINPRFSGGLGRLARVAPSAHLALIQLNALIGRDIGRPAAQVEHETRALLDQHLFVDAHGVSAARTLDAHTEVPVVAGPARLDEAAAMEPEPSEPAEPAATPAAPVLGFVSAGPSPLGTFVRLHLGDQVVGAGDRAAAFGALLLDFADRHWDTGFGRVLIAPDVRAASIGADEWAHG